MKMLHVYMLVMSDGENTSGVDRYIEVLSHAWRGENIRIYLIEMSASSSIRFIKRYDDGILSVSVIPLPYNFSRIVGEEYWTNEYYSEVIRVIKPLLEGKENRIVHIHTLNLIDLALMIKKQYGCKIITHVHCIPWKGLYNTDRVVFNELYRIYYYDKSVFKSSLSNFVLSPVEMRAYTEADHIICVTKSGVHFLKQTVKVLCNISLIYNALQNDDACVFQRSLHKTDTFRFLFVGDFSQSKGFSFILQAMKIVKERFCDVELVAIGKVSDRYKEQVFCKYGDLKILFTGLLKLNDLAGYYKKCDVGIIASLQDQCSYVALEMMKYKLPIIVTDVDGLNELFVDNYNCLKTRIIFSVVEGLRVDVEHMAYNMCKLISNDSLRSIISKNAYKRFVNYYTSANMVRKTAMVYKALYK